MNFVQKIGLALLGKQALAEIKKDVVTITTASVQAEEGLKRVSAVNAAFDDGVKTTVKGYATYPAGTQALVLENLVGKDATQTLIKAAGEAEASGEGFMKKKAAVHKIAKTLGLSKSGANLAVELAVQLIK